MGLGVGQQHASCFGQMCFSALLLEELYPKLFLQSSDRVADRRLRAVELLRCRREPAQLDHGMQDLPFIKSSVHSGPIYRIFRYIGRKNTTFRSKFLWLNIRLFGYRLGNPREKADRAGKRFPARSIWIGTKMHLNCVKI